MTQESRAPLDRLAFRIVGFAQRRAWHVIAAVLGLTVIFGVLAARVEVSSALDELFPDDVERLLRERGQSRAERDFLILAAHGSDAFAVDALGALDRAIQRIEALDEVTGSITPFNLLTFGTSARGSMTIAPVSAAGRAPGSAPEAALLKRRLLADPTSRKLLVAADGNTIGAIFNVPRRDDYAHLFSALERITAPLTEYYAVHWGGNPTFDHSLKQRLTTDLPRLLIAALAVIMISYYVTFRGVLTVAMPLIVVLVGTIWTVGTMRLLGISFTITSIMTPPLVLSLGSAYSVHILTDYYAGVSRRGPLRASVRWAMARVTATIVLAALTTIIGFSSLLTGSLVQVREFGLITGIGIAYCALLALLFLPACLTLLPAPSRARRALRAPAILSALARLGETRWKYLVIVAAAALAVVCVASLGRLRYDTDIARMFGRDSRLIQDNLFVGREMVGALDVNITFTAPAAARNFFLDPAQLQHVADLEQALRNDPDVAYVASFVTQISRMNLAARGTYEVPRNRALIGAFARLLQELPEGRASDALLQSTIEQGAASLTVNVRITETADDGGRLVNEQEFRETVARIEELVADIMPAAVEAEIWSNGMAILSAADNLLLDQVRSAIVSVVLVFLVTAVGFRSLLFGAYTLIPVVAGLMTNFTLMALADIPLDGVTMTLSALSIGVGVDHAIHLLLAYRRERGAAAAGAGAITLALLSSGRSILISALSLAAGLLVLVASTFPPIAVYGLLLAVLVLSTLVGSLVILPVVMALTRGGPARAAAAPAPEPERPGAVP